MESTDAADEEALLVELKELEDELEEVLAAAPLPPPARPFSPGSDNGEGQEDEADAIEIPEHLLALLGASEAVEIGSKGSIARTLPPDTLGQFVREKTGSGDRKGQSGATNAKARPLACTFKVSGAPSHKNLQFVSLGYAFRHVCELLLSANTSSTKARAKAGEAKKKAEAFARSLLELISEDIFRRTAMQCVFGLLRPSVQDKITIRPAAVSPAKEEGEEESEGEDGDGEGDGVGDGVNESCAVTLATDAEALGSGGVSSSSIEEKVMRVRYSCLLQASTSSSSASSSSSSVSFFRVTLRAELSLFKALNASGTANTASNDGNDEDGSSDAQGATGDDEDEQLEVSFTGLHSTVRPASSASDFYSYSSLRSAGQEGALAMMIAAAKDRLLGRLAAVDGSRYFSTAAYLQRAWEVREAAAAASSTADADADADNMGKEGIGAEGDENESMTDTESARERLPVNPVPFHNAFTGLLPPSGTSTGCGAGSALLDDLGTARDEQRLRARLAQKALLASVASVPDEGEGLLGWDRPFDHDQRRRRDRDLVLSPRIVPPGRELGSFRVVQISCSANHCAAITDVGALFTWGSTGAHGELGLGDLVESSSVVREPRLVPFFGIWHPLRALAVSCGSGPLGSHTLVIASGFLLEEQQQAALSARARSGVDSTKKGSAAEKASALDVVSAARRGLAVAALGRVFSFGVGHACGVEALDPVFTPRLVLASNACDLYHPFHGGVAAVAAGSSFSAAVTRSGALYMWGITADGRLGLKSSGDAAAGNPTAAPMPRININNSKAGSSTSNSSSKFLAQQQQKLEKGSRLQVLSPERVVEGWELLPVSSPSPDASTANDTAASAASAAASADSPQQHQDEHQQRFRPSPSSAPHLQQWLGLLDPPSLDLPAAAPIATAAATAPKEKGKQSKKPSLAELLLWRESLCPVFADSDSAAAMGSELAFTIPISSIACGSGSPDPRGTPHQGGQAIALDAFGGCWSWGYNDSGALGVGSRATVLTPVPVQFVGGGGGGGGGAGGSNEASAGAAALSPSPVLTLVAAGSDHSLALDLQGRVWVWGCANAATIGRYDTSRTNRRQLKPRLVPPFGPQAGPASHVFAVAACSGARGVSSILSANGDAYVLDVSSSSSPPPLVTPLRAAAGPFQGSFCQTRVYSLALQADRGLVSIPRGLLAGASLTELFTGSGLPEAVDSGADGMGSNAAAGRRRHAFYREALTAPDLMIRTADADIPAHRCVLSAHSPVFDRMLRELPLPRAGPRSLVLRGSSSGGGGGGGAANSSLLQPSTVVGFLLSAVPIRADTLPLLVLTDLDATTAPALLELLYTGQVVVQQQQQQLSRAALAKLLKAAERYSLDDALLTALRRLVTSPAHAWLRALKRDNNNSNNNNGNANGGGGSKRGAASRKRSKRPAGGEVKEGEEEGENDDGDDDDDAAEAEEKRKEALAVAKKDEEEERDPNLLDNALALRKHIEVDESLLLAGPRAVDRAGDDEGGDGAGMGMGMEAGAGAAALPLPGLSSLRLLNLLADPTCADVTILADLLPPSASALPPRSSVKSLSSLGFRAQACLLASRSFFFRDTLATALEVAVNEGSSKLQLQLPESPLTLARLLFFLHTGVVAPLPFAATLPSSSSSSSPPPLRLLSSNEWLPGFEALPRNLDYRLAGSSSSPSSSSSLSVASGHQEEEEEEEEEGVSNEHAVDAAGRSAVLDLSSGLPALLLPSVWSPLLQLLLDLTAASRYGLYTYATALEQTLTASLDVLKTKEWEEGGSGEDKGDKGEKALPLRRGDLLRLLDGETVTTSSGACLELSSVLPLPLLAEAVGEKRSSFSSSSAPAAGIDPFAESEGQDREEPGDDDDDDDDDPLDLAPGKTELVLAEVTNNTKNTDKNTTKPLLRLPLIEDPYSIDKLVPWWVPLGLIPAALLGAALAAVPALAPLVPLTNLAVFVLLLLLAARSAGSI